MATDVSIETLIRQIQACRLCQDQLPHTPRPVLQVSQSATILIAGQAPGAKVHASGIPFDDASGERLRQWLGIEKPVFYDARQVAIVPMAFCFPGSGEHGDLAPPRLCADTWRKTLLDHLPNTRLTLLIGRYAQQWHLPSERNHTLTALVRQTAANLETQDTNARHTTLALPHPSPRNNRWLSKNPWFETTVLPQLKDQIQRALRAAR